MDRGGRARGFSLAWDFVVSDELKEVSVGHRGSQAKLSIYRPTGDKPRLSVVSGEIKYEKPCIEFCTTSSYTGQWNALGMSGFGTYVFPHGVEYEGYFEDGQFHGEGTLTYPMGQKIDGKWVKGNMVSHSFRFADGLEYFDNWDYCKMPDRRFYISTLEGLRPAGREFLTNEQPTRIIPPGNYDTCRGFFDPKTRCITSQVDSAVIQKKMKDASQQKVENVIGLVKDRPHVEAVTDEEEEWIIKNCRKSWDEATGYRPDLYEYWVTGRWHELAAIDEEASDMSSVMSNITDYTIEVEDEEEEGVEVAEEEKPERDDITKIWLIPSNIDMDDD